MSKIILAYDPDHLDGIYCESNRTGNKHLGFGASCQFPPWVLNVANTIEFL